MERESCNWLSGYGIENEGGREGEAESWGGCAKRGEEREREREEIGIRVRV